MEQDRVTAMGCSWPVDPGYWDGSHVIQEKRGDSLRWWLKSVRSGAVAGEVLAILMAMTTDAEYLPLADVKNRLSEVVERLEREHGRVVITKYGRPAAVVLSVDDLEGLEETLEILSDQGLMRRIRKADAEIAAGAAQALSREQALAIIHKT